MNCHDIRMAALADDMFIDICKKCGTCIIDIEKTRKYLINPKDPTLYERSVISNNVRPLVKGKLGTIISI